MNWIVNLQGYLPDTKYPAEYPVDIGYAGTALIIFHFSAYYSYFKNVRTCFVAMRYPEVDQVASVPGSIFFSAILFAQRLKMKHKFYLYKENFVPTGLTIQISNAWKNSVHKLNLFLMILPACIQEKKIYKI